MVANPGGCLHRTIQRPLGLGETITAGEPQAKLQAIGGKRDSSTSVKDRHSDLVPEYWACIIAADVTCSPCMNGDKLVVAWMRAYSNLLSRALPRSPYSPAMTRGDGETGTLFNSSPTASMGGELRLAMKGTSTRRGKERPRHPTASASPSTPGRSARGKCWRTT